MPKKLASEDRLRLMKFVCSFAWADLQIAEQERKFVKKMIRRLALTDAEKEAFAHSSGAVRKTCDEVDEMLKTL